MKSKKILFVFALVAGISFSVFFNYSLQYTSTNEFCESCHVHPQATQSWKISSHAYNKSGVVVKCVECHLPPEGLDYLYAKTTTGIRDLYGFLFKDSSDYNWEEKSQREFAVLHVYKEACTDCHQNLFSSRLSKKGEDAHVYYDQNSDELRCINCHLQVGHYHEPTDESKEEKTTNMEVYQSPAEVDSFISFTEKIPGTNIDFEMIAIPGGSYLMGSPEDEKYRKMDEGPQRNVEVSQFWIGKFEISWNEYSAFMKETGKEGRTEDQIKRIVSANTVDGISGPTPPYGNPGQGWGRGKRPAITMTHYAATKYCEWLSLKTGKKYRLPTEAEWEYACRGGTSKPYFFDGNPEDFSRNGFFNNLFGPDTTSINSFVIYRENSGNKTALPEELRSNQFGLVNMLGNVREFCSDYYQKDYYSSLSDETIKNSTGPSEGNERVIRGGSYKSDAADLRCAARDFTQTKKWLVTDPQIPKSLWWYSDVKDVGFRVVCEYKN